MIFCLSLGTRSFLSRFESFWTEVGKKGKRRNFQAKKAAKMIILGKREREREKGISSGRKERKGGKGGKESKLIRPSQERNGDDEDLKN